MSRFVLSKLQMHVSEWPDLLPLFWPPLNCIPCPQRQNLAPSTAYTRIQFSPPLLTFFHTETSSSKTFNATRLSTLMRCFSLLRILIPFSSITPFSATVHKAKIRQIRVHFLIFLPETGHLMLGPTSRLERNSLYANVGAKICLSD